MRILRVLCIGAMQVSSAAAVAADVNGGVSAGVIRSDNIARTHDDQIKDTVYDVSGNLLFHEATVRTQADVRANLQYENYDKDTFSSDVVGDAAAYGDFSFVPDRFDWYAQDNFGQQRLTPGVADTPENRENINYFSTGPRFAFNLGPQNSVKLGGDYSKVSYEDTDADNNRYGGLAAFVRQLDPSRSASLNASYERINYSNDVDNVDFARRQAFARFASATSRATLAVEAGYNEIHSDLDKTGEPLLRLEATRVVSASSKLSLFAGKEFSDAGSLLRTLQTQSQTPATGPGQVVIPAQVNVPLGANNLQRSTDPFSNRYVRAGWDFAKNRTGFNLGASYSKEAHETQVQLNHSVTGINGGLSRRLRPTLTAQLGFGYYKNNYIDGTPSSKQSDGTASIAWRAGRHVNVSAGYERFHQSSEIAESRYNENRYFLSVGAVWDPAARP